MLKMRWVLFVVASNGLRLIHLGIILDLTWITFVIQALVLKLNLLDQVMIRIIKITISGTIFSDHLTIRVILIKLGGRPLVRAAILVLLEVGSGWGLLITRREVAMVVVDGRVLYFFAFLAYRLFRFDQSFDIFDRTRKLVLGFLRWPKNIFLLSVNIISFSVIKI